MSDALGVRVLSLIKWQENRHFRLLHLLAALFALFIILTDVFVPMMLNLVRSGYNCQHRVNYPHSPEIAKI